MTDTRIKCGKCNCEYYPRKRDTAERLDYSCPVCGFGKVQESETKQKQILND